LNAIKQEFNFTPSLSPNMESLLRPDLLNSLHVPINVSCTVIVN
jgi:hypothetical protein